MGRKSMEQKMTVGFKTPETTKKALESIATSDKRNMSDWLNIFLTGLVEDDQKTIKECLEQVKDFRSKNPKK